MIKSHVINLIILYNIINEMNVKPLKGLAESEAKIKNNSDEINNINKKSRF